jgi:hypothetical protein
MKPAQKRYTLLCRATYMVHFGYSGAIFITDNCNTNNNASNGGFGIPQSSFVNDTGLPGSTLFTGEGKFTVKELEIFEISV